MRAAICYEFGKPLVIEEVEIDPPAKDEVKIRMVAVGVCHSDINQFRGRGFEKVPLVAGHECAGYIEQVGANVTSVKSGDPVVASFVRYCGKCHYCLSGLPHLCEFQWPPESFRRLTNKQGQRLGALNNMSGFAEYMVVHESQAIPIPRNMPMDSASLLGCCVMTGFGAVAHRAQVKPYSSVAVIGTGGVGLNAIQGAAHLGAYPVIALDILDSKLKVARNFGATHTINTSKEDTPQVIKQLTSGRGADYVFVTVGNVNAMNLGLSITGKRGMAVVVGVIGESLPVNLIEFIITEKILTGTGMGSTNTKVHIPQLISLYQAGQLKLDELITKRYPLSKINEAIESTEKGEAIRNVITFE